MKGDQNPEAERSSKSFLPSEAENLKARCDNAAHHRIRDKFRILCRSRGRVGAAGQCKRIKPRPVRNAICAAMKFWFRPMMESFI
jgi:hypothetical protein